jgi:hypothetical protein
MSRLNVADKYRGVIRGSATKSSIFGASGATKASHRVFGVQQQLYKDVDSDHQQKMLHSNIYIPDYESESRNDDTNFSDNRRGDTRTNRILQMSVDQRQRFSNFDPSSTRVQQLLDSNHDLQELEGSQGLPAISRRRKADINFATHFRKRQMSVAEEVKRNIEI